MVLDSRSCVSVPPSWADKFPSSPAATRSAHWLPAFSLRLAEDPKKALLLAAEHPGEIHMLITDGIMPGMNGRDLANRLADFRPAIKRLFISGFTADVIAQRGILDEGMSFLSKPFGRDVLARKVREILGNP